MGGFVEDAFNAIGGAITDAWNWFVDAISGIGNFLYESILTPIMNFLGFQDQKICNALIKASKVFDSNFLSNTRTQLIMDKREKGYDSLTYAKGYSKVGDTQFSKFYRHGKWDYYNYLPDSNVIACSIDIENIKAVIESYVGNTIYIDDCILMVPTDEDWCKFQLQQLYGYHLDAQFLEYGNNFYSYSSQYYNPDNNTYEVRLNSITSISIITQQRIEKTKVSGTQYRVDTYKRELYQNTANGIYLRTEPYQLISTTYETHSGIVDTLEETVLQVEPLDAPSREITLTVPANSGNIEYVVKYKVDGNTKLWIEEVDKYSSISTPTKVLKGFEMYPVVMVRNDSKDVNEYADYDKDTEEYRRYKQTYDLLNYIGIDLGKLTDGYANPDSRYFRHGFVLLGVSPSSTKDIVSRALYEIFDYIYDLLPFVNGRTDESYSAAFKEEPFNCAIMWTPRPIIFGSGKYQNMSIGDCYHKVGLINVTITKKEKVNGRKKIMGFNEWYLYIEDIEELEFDDGQPTIISSKGNRTLVVNADEDPENDNKYELYRRPNEFTDEITVSTEHRTSRSLIVAKQIEENRYKVITLSDMVAINVIRSSECNSGVNLNADDADFVIPLPVGVVERLTLMQKTDLLGEAVYLVFYVTKEQTIHWWQTPQFATFLQILGWGITITVSLLSMGSGTTMTVFLQKLLFSIAIGGALQLSLLAVNSWVKDPVLNAVLSIGLMIGAAYMAGNLKFESFSTEDMFKLGQISAKGLTIFTKVERYNPDYQGLQEAYQERMETFTKIRDEMDTGITAEFLAGLNRETTFDISLLHPDTILNAELNPFFGLNDVNLVLSLP